LYFKKPHDLSCGEMLFVMKRVSILCLLLLSIVVSYAQSIRVQEVKRSVEKNELSLGYGYITRDNFLNGFGRISRKLIINDSLKYRLNSADAYKLFGTDKSVGYGTLKSSGAFFGSYRHTVLPWLSVGLTAGFEKETKDLQIGGNAVGLYTRYVITIAPELQARYYHKGLTTMYGALGIGNTFVNEQYTSLTSDKHIDATDNYAGFQVSPIGLKVGKKLSGFGEIGFGYKGVVQLGISYKY
jgi:hypothetical protein